MLLPKREAPRLIELARRQGNVFRVSRPWRTRYLTLGVATPVIFVGIPLAYAGFDGSYGFLAVGLMVFLTLGLGGTFAAVALRGLVAVSTEGLVIRAMGTQVFSWEDEELFIGGLPGGFGGEASLTLVNPFRRIPRQLAIGRFERTDDLMGAIEAASLAYTQGTATSETLGQGEEQARYSEIMAAARLDHERRG